MIQAPADRLPAAARGRSGPGARRRRRYAWLTVTAGSVLVVMTYFPTIFVLSNSLKSGQGIFSNSVFSLFTQFDYRNYLTAWSGVSHQLINTIIVAAASIAIGVTAAALGAYAFSQLRFRGKGLLFMAYVALLLIPWTLTLIPLFLTIQKLHFFNTWWALILPYAATAQPLLVLIFRSFFEQIPRELYESARVDAGPDSGCRQSGFQIRVFRNETWRLPGETLVWDSGHAESGDCTDIAYGGPALAPGARYAWQVRVWDGAGLASDWSPEASFEVELDQEDGWQAAWVGQDRARESITPPTGAGPVDPVGRGLTPAPYLRRVFSVDKPVVSARLHVTARGLYEARLNGQRVGEAFLSPGWTDYGKRVLYQTYDVTPLLTSGENVLGAIIADGWYSGYVGFDSKRAGAHYGTMPELLAQLVITFGDGSQDRVVTDEHWTVAAAAIRHADLLMGEKHDLRLEPHGWDTPGFDDTGWRAVRCRDRDSTPLVADPGPPIRVTETIRPAGVSRDGSGRHIIDFGQNLTGWVRLRAGAPAGTTIRIRHAEALDGDGGLYTQNLRTARQTDEFILAGAPSALLEPRFTVHGFRYAEIAGYPGDLGMADIEACVVHSDIEAGGAFSSSAEWLNQLLRVIDWGQRGNFISIPTDCPQRDERLGWLGDAQIFARTACYNRDVAAFFAKWLDDVADAQLESGAFTDVAPRLTFTRPAAPAWGDGGVIIPWTMWKMYGDTGILRRHFGGMTAWMDFVERANPDYLRAREVGSSYNDWLAPGADDTPRDLLATAYWAHDAALMGEIADAIGRPEDAAGYRGLHAKIRSAFTDAFVAGDGQIASGTQTAYVLGLHMGLIPDELRGAAAGHLVAAIRDADWHLTTGFVGVGYLLPVLSSHGSVRGTIAAGWERSGGEFTFRVELPLNVTASVRIPSGQAADVRDHAGSRPAALAPYPGAAGVQEAVFQVGPGTHEFSGPAMTGPV